MGNSLRQEPESGHRSTLDGVSRLAGLVCGTRLFRKMKDFHSANPCYTDNLQPICYSFLALFLTGP